MEIREQIIQVMIEKGFNPESEKQKLKDDLGMDSLDVIELIIDCEKELGINVDFELEDKAHEMTVGEFINEFEKYKNETATHA